MASSLGALIGPLFDAGESPKQDKKRAVKPRKNKTTKGEGSVTEPKQQHGELASAAMPGNPNPGPQPYVEPTPVERTQSHARDAKVRATQDWVEGRMTTKQHENIHSRANHVLMSRRPKEFKGTTGEKAPKMGKSGMRGMW